MVHHSVEKPGIEICLTHPIDGIHERLIWPAVREVIMGAKSRITVVGYEISGSPAVVFESLMEKSIQGVELAFLVDRLEGKKYFLEWVKKLPYQPELYTREKDPADPESSLHMKCIVVDDDIAVVGSANPTYHGMMKNIEICLVIRDRDVVMRISRIVDRLKQELAPYGC
jgi:cardiolipin synthase